MHAPDGFLNLGTAVATGAISAGAVGASLRQTGQTLKQAGLELGLVDEPTFDRLVLPADMV